MRRLIETVQTGTAQVGHATPTTVSVATPGFAEKAIVYLNVTAVDGTTPLTDMKFQYVHPVTENAVDMQWNGVTQIAGTTAANVVAVLGGYDTEDDTGPVYFLKDALPSLWNIVLTFDIADTDETYTYDVTVEWIG